MNSPSSIHVRAYAKLNLFLDVLGHVGHLHQLRMVMQSISLYDELSIEPLLEHRVLVSCSNPSLNQLNSVEEAFKLVQAAYPSYISHGFRVFIRKNIPMGAGLAGGSADAAAMVNICKWYFNVPMTRDEISCLNLSIGSDVNFCYYGGSKYVEGVGERLSEAKLPYSYFLVVYPGIHISTKEIFRLWDVQMRDYCPVAIPDAELSGTFYNAFERLVFSMYPEIEFLKRKILDLGASHALMSGSGSTVYGVFPNKESAQTAQKEFISTKGLQTFVAKKINHGISRIHHR